MKLPPRVISTMNIWRYLSSIYWPWNICVDPFMIVYWVWTTIRCTYGRDPRSRNIRANWSALVVSSRAQTFWRLKSELLLAGHESHTVVLVFLCISGPNRPFSPTPLRNSAWRIPVLLRMGSSESDVIWASLYSSLKILDHGGGYYQCRSSQSNVRCLASVACESRTWFLLEVVIVQRLIKAWSVQGNMGKFEPGFRSKDIPVMHSGSSRGLEYKIVSASEGGDRHLYSPTTVSVTMLRCFRGFPTFLNNWFMVDWVSASEASEEMYSMHRASTLG